MREARLPDRIIAFLIVILPLTFYYKAPFLFSELSTLLIMFLGIIVLYRNIGIIIIRPNSDEGASITFGIWMIIVTIIASFLPYYKSYIFSFVSIITVLLIIQMIKKMDFLWSYLTKYYRIVAYICLALYAIQLFAYYALGNGISFKLPLELSPAYVADFDYVSRSYRNVQLSSLFAEKAHFAQYMIPLEILTLTEANNIKQYVKTIIISALVISSASGVGIVATAIVWGIYFLRRSENGGATLKKTAITIAAIVVLVIAHNILLEHSIQYANSIARLFVSEGTALSKADYRVYRGFASFFKMPLLSKIFGVGYKQYSSFAGLYGIVTKYDVATAQSEYFSAFSQVFIYFGIIGAIIVGISLIYLYKSSNKDSRMMLITLIAISVSSSIFLEPTCLLYFAFVFALNKQTDNMLIGEYSNAT